MCGPMQDAGTPYLLAGLAGINTLLAPCRLNNGCLSRCLRPFGHVVGEIGITSIIKGPHVAVAAYPPSFYSYAPHTLTSLSVALQLTRRPSGSAASALTPLVRAAIVASRTAAPPLATFHTLRAVAAVGFP